MTKTTEIYSVLMIFTQISYHYLNKPELFRYFFYLLTENGPLMPNITSIMGTISNMMGIYFLVGKDCLLIGRTSITFIVLF